MGAWAGEDEVALRVTPGQSSAWAVVADEKVEWWLAGVERSTQLKERHLAIMPVIMLPKFIVQRLTESEFPLALGATDKVLRSPRR